MLLCIRKYSNRILTLLLEIFLMCFPLQPLLFESIVIDQLQHLKEVVTSQRSEENEDVSIIGI